MLERYYNLFDPAKRYTQLLFRAGDGLQSRELNEIQSALIHRLQGEADAILKDGDIVSGANLQIDSNTGLVTLEAGRIYLRGAVREILATSFTVPTTGRVAVGGRFRVRTITELEDPGLREPAVGVRNYQEPGAGRLQESLAWGWEGAKSSDGQTGDFHGVYALDHGILENRRQPPALDGVIASLARYDYDANGHYVTEGLGVRFLKTEEQTHVFSIAEGRANIDGFKVERAASQRLSLPIDPDLQRVSSEPQVFNDRGDGSMAVSLNRTPLASVLDVKATKQKTETLVHGAFTGSRDALTEAAIVAVLAVKQGGATYSQGTDYKLAGDAIDWSPAARLALAEIACDWRKGSAPEARTIAVRTIRASELTAMQRQIADLYDLMALERLRIDANIREPAAKKGLFVDNFLDDDLRDQGVPQSGAIVGGVRCDLAADRGQRLARARGRDAARGTGAGLPVRGSPIPAAAHVSYRVEGFGPGEALAQLRFDSLVLAQASAVAADAAGRLVGDFQIPDNIPAGAKLVEFLGAGGGYGLATFVGRGQIVTETRRQILTTVVRRWDPLAQTFTLPGRRVLGGVDLWFTGKGGAAPVIVQIRETQVGMPATAVLTEGRLAASEIKIDGNPTRIALAPAALEANREYAIVALTDDANHAVAVAVAELGKFDPQSGWVTAQPYQIGVLLSSSNGVTWTPHQSQDLTFRLLACRFTETSRRSAWASIR